MKRFIASMLFAATFAEEETAGKDNSDSGGWFASVKNWAKSQQEPVEFDSITTGDPYTLGGKYLRYTRAGIDFAQISQWVGGAEIPDDAMVLTWAEIPDPEMTGQIEAFYCSVKYNSQKETGENVDVETFEGTEVNLADEEGSPDLWCPVEVWVEQNQVAGCKRHSVAQWQEFFDTELYASSWDADTSVSSQTCGAWRKMSSPDNYLEIKTGVEYTVRTGYKTYDSTTDYAAGKIAHWGTGTYMPVIFEGSAVALIAAAGASALASALTF